MVRRLVSASILIAIILALLTLDYRLADPQWLGRCGVALSIIAVFLASLASSEFISLWNQPDHLQGRSLVNPSIPSGALVTFSAVMMCLIAGVLPAVLQRFDAAGFPILQPDAGDWSPLMFSLYGLLLAFSISVGYEMWNFRTDQVKPGEVTDRIARSALIYVYLITLFGFLIPHRWLEGNAMGLITIIALIATIKMSDSCALFAGKTLGTVKLAPSLSPNKTIQGAIGAYLGAAVAASVVFYGVAPQVFGIEFNRSAGWVAIYVISITTAGILGDLAESMLKRDAQRKDSSSWIPGLGGILDVLDSLVFACPVSYLLWMLPT